MEKTYRSLDEFEKDFLPDYNKEKEIAEIIAPLSQKYHDPFETSKKLLKYMKENMVALPDLPEELRACVVQILTPKDFREYFKFRLQVCSRNGK